MSYMTFSAVHREPDLASCGTGCSRCRSGIGEWYARDPAIADRPPGTPAARIPGLSGFAVAPSPAVTLRYFTCSPTDHKAIEELLKMSIPPATLRAAVHTAVTNAAVWARRAADTLKRGARTAASRRLFQEAFGTTPEFVPAWRPAGKTWDRGDVVRARLLYAARILAGGWIRFYCWGAPGHCPECTRATPSYYACSSWGKHYVICLGQQFWRDWQARREVSMASTMLHEALHIYFGRLVGHGETGRYGDANCYVRFTLRANALDLPPRIATRCAAA